MIRLWTSGFDSQRRTEVRPFGENSPLLGHIVEHAGVGGHPPFWNFSSACYLGNAVRTHLYGEKEITLLDEFETALETAWAKEVGKPTPDAKQECLWFSPTEIRDRLAGQAVRYHDVVCWDIDLGAIMRRYLSAGWGEYFYWSPPSPLGNRLKDKLNGYGGLAKMQERFREAWAEETGT